jgi:alkyl hydroperoxide reductase subunit AhpF
MSLLKFLDRSPLRAALAEITAPVTLRVILADDPLPDVWAALTDLVTLSQFIHIEREDDALAEVDEVQVIGDAERGLHFLGLPMGNELAPLLSAVLVTGRRDSGLAPSIRQALRTLTEPVYVEVFTTPT